MLFMPATANMVNSNASVDIHYNIEFVNDIVSTRLYDESIEDELIFDLSSYFKNQFISTQIELGNISDNNSSTWFDWNENNFDIISNFLPKKRYKLNSKIISISKFTPKIVIE